MIPEKANQPLTQMRSEREVAEKTALSVHDCDCLSIGCCEHDPCCSFLQWRIDETLRRQNRRDGWLGEALS